MNNLSIINWSQSASVFVLTLVIGCTPPQPKTTFEPQRIISEVTVFFNDYYEAITSKGLIGEWPYLGFAADFFRVPPGFTCPISFDSVRTHLEMNAHLFMSIENSWDEIRNVPLNDSIATYTSALSSKMVYANDSTATLKLMETGVVRKRKGRWKLLCGQTQVSESK